MATYDIHFQPVAADQVRGYKCFEFGFTAALKVRGLQYLVNRWIKTFMTPRGSNPLYPEEGTAFGQLVGSNISQVSSDIRDMVIMAVEDANDQVREQDVIGLFSDDERLQNGELLEFVEAADGFEVWVQITNVAGESLQVPVVTLSAG